MSTIYNSYQANKIAIDLETSGNSSSDPWEFRVLCQHHDAEKCPLFLSHDDNCLWWKVAAYDEHGEFIGYW